MTDLLFFSVDGIPVPEGSVRGRVYQDPRGTRARAIVYHDNNRRLMLWRTAVAVRARLAMLPQARAITLGAVALTAVCVLPRPKTGRRAQPIVRPDVDKLARALLDALTGVVWTDDAQVVQLSVHKRYTWDAETPRADVWIKSVADYR